MSKRIIKLTQSRIPPEVPSIPSITAAPQVSGEQVIPVRHRLQMWLLGTSLLAQEHQPVLDRSTGKRFSGCLCSSQLESRSETATFMLWCAWVNKIYPRANSCASQPGLLYSPVSFLSHGLSPAGCQGCHLRSQPLFYQTTCYLNSLRNIYMLLTVAHWFPSLICYRPWDLNLDLRQPLIQEWSGHSLHSAPAPRCAWGAWPGSGQGGGRAKDIPTAELYLPHHQRAHKSLSSPFQAVGSIKLYLLYPDTTQSPRTRPGTLIRR